MQAEVVKADQGFKLQRHADASVKKATGDATSVKISAEANAEAIIMQMQKHQNNCNGVNWWCHFSKRTIRSRSI
jgi:hypothetical protein